MSIKIREIYYYAVCFVTLIICIFALTGLINSLTQLAYPNPPYTPSKTELIHQYEAIQAKLHDDQTLEQWIKEEQVMLQEREKQLQKNQMARELSRNISLVIVSVPLYFYHWRRVRKTEG